MIAQATNTFTENENSAGKDVPGWVYSTFYNTQCTALQYIHNWSSSLHINESLVHKAHML